MQITLPPEIQAIIEHEIQSGRYATAEEVVVEAVRHLQDATTPSVPDEWLVEARAQADRGETVPWTDDFMERAAQRAREKSAQGHQVRDDIKY
jgi:putative addiction module CopG family antidote